MASFVRERFAATALERIAAIYGQTGSYRLFGGTAVTGLTLLLLPGDGDSSLRLGDAVSVDTKHAVVWVQQSELPAPTRDGTFTIGADAWVINGPPTDEAGWWKCPVARETKFATGKIRE